MGGGIFRARLRRDGFVSVDNGVLTTPPFQIEGRELLLNAVGPIKVQVLDASGKTARRGHRERRLHPPPRPLQRQDAPPSGDRKPVPLTLSSPPAKPTCIPSP